MTKDVLVSISGLHFDMLSEQSYKEDELGDETIEVITPANYFCKNGKHYVIYDEIAEGGQGSTKNKIKITGTDTLEIIKSGLLNAHMVFERNKKNLTYYNTPFGQMLIGVNTKNMNILVSEDDISVKVDYELDLNHSPLADCRIRLTIKSKEAGDGMLS
ncbi:DUF1934 domain-containing protein [Lachnospiraceae bacterium LCP25S3_G4]